VVNASPIISLAKIDHNPLPTEISTMSKLTIERKNLIEAVNTLPDEMLIELANFVEYLRYKTVQHQPSVTPEPNFLLTIAGIGNSGQVDISDSDEEILRNEIDPIYGWGNKPKEQP
jgi:hypothetical protein